MSDLISRQDAVEAVYEALRTPLPCYGNNLLQDSMTLAKAIVNNIPSAEPEPEEFEWCHGCKEYDQEKHCCHRWTSFIRYTVKDLKEHYEHPAKVEDIEEVYENVNEFDTRFYKKGDCGRCGETVKEGEKFCHECGAKLEWNE